MSDATGAVTALLAAVRRLDTQAVLAALHDDLLFQLPFERGAPTWDKAGFGRMFDGLVDGFQRLDMNVVEVIEGADPSRLVARYDGDCLSKDGSVSYQNNYVALFTITDGLVAEWREYANPVLTRRMNEQLSAVQP